MKPAPQAGASLRHFDGNGRRGVMTMEVLHLYTDESGTDRRSSVVSVATFAGSQEMWWRFESSWRPKLEAFGRGPFHASQSRFDHLRPDLIDAIHKSGVVGYVIQIPVDMFRTHASAQFRSLLGNEYALGALATIGYFCDRSVEILGNHPVAIVLEHGQPNVDFVRDSLDRLIDGRLWNIVSVAKATKDDFVELQAADCLAHIRYRNEQQWLDRLKDNRGRFVFHEELLTPAALKHLSLKVRRGLARRRARRRAERKARHENH